MIHRNIENQKRLKKIAFGWYKPGIAYYYEKENRYIKTNRGSHSKYIKKSCNRKVRRYKGEISNGNCYRKIEEYWWELFQ